jgi:hypothetical protein
MAQIILSGRFRWCCAGRLLIYLDTDRGGINGRKVPNQNIQAIGNSFYFGNVAGRVHEHLCRGYVARDDTVIRGISSSIRCSAFDPGLLNHIC